MPLDISKLVVETFRRVGILSSWHLREITLAGYVQVQGQASPTKPRYGMAVLLLEGLPQALALMLLPSSEV